jgi:hypothetical protein
MKNYIKLLLVALALSLSLAACKGNKSGGSADSLKADSTSVTKIDSTIEPDTSKKDSSKMISGDTTKKIDTISKTTVKTTEEKKKSVKKN